MLDLAPSLLGVQSGYTWLWDIFLIIGVIRKILQGHIPLYQSAAAGIGDLRFQYSTLQLKHGKEAIS